jgi:putative flippase GtrA
MSKRDFYFILSIGALVGLLVQPVLQNTLPAFFSDSVPMWIFVAAWFVFFIGAPVALYICFFLSRFILVLYQFGKFAAVGVLNTFVDLGVFNFLAFPILSKALTLSVAQFVIFKSISFIIANANSYWWNSRWTFSTSSHSGSRALSFYAVSILGFFVNVLTAYGVNFLFTTFSFSSGVAANSAVVSAVIISMIFNFIGYKYFVFKK